MVNNKISEFVTFPKTFENYKWHKPILVMLLTLIMLGIFGSILMFVFSGLYGWDFVLSLSRRSYEAMNTEVGQIFMDLGVILFIPSLYVASKIIKDRPFSSYSSSRGGFNYKLYFKALVIPLVMYIIYEALTIKNPNGINHFTVPFLIICLILVPLQCIAEEYIFRGLLFQTLGSWFNIPILALIIQAIIFTVTHGYNSIGLIEVFVSGIFLGFMTLKTNGIEVSSAWHTVNNLISALMAMFGLEMTTSAPTLGSVAPFVAFQIILFVVMYFVGNKTSWFGEIEDEHSIE